MSRLAVAESDYKDPGKLYFSVYEVNESNDTRVRVSRQKVDLPEDYRSMSPSPVPPDQMEESKAGFLA